MSRSIDEGGSAMCQTPGCGWTMTSDHASAALGHGGKHVKQKGHTVRVDVHQTVMLGERATDPEALASGTLFA